MSHLPSKRQLKSLAKFNEPYCVSIYAPYIEPTGSTNPNRIELKNLIKQAHSALRQAGIKPKEIDKTLKPVKDLLEGQEFWPVRRESLAIFAHPRLFKYYRIPGDVPHKLVIDHGFNLEPLRAVVANNKTYMVLALDHNDVHLYKANRYQIKPIKVKGLPTNMVSALNIDEFPKTIEPHAVASLERKGSYSFHGQYNVSQTDKTMLLQFFRRINKQLHKFLHDKQIPVVLTGVNYLLPIYQTVNTYPHLFALGVKGSSHTMSLDSLREKAWDIVSRTNSMVSKHLHHSEKALN